MLRDRPRLRTRARLEARKDGVRGNGVDGHFGLGRGSPRVATCPEQFVFLATACYSFLNVFELACGVGPCLGAAHLLLRAREGTAREVRNPRR